MQSSMLVDDEPMKGDRNLISIANDMNLAQRAGPVLMIHRFLSRDEI